MHGKWEYHYTTVKAHDCNDESSLSGQKNRKTISRVSSIIQRYGSLNRTYLPFDRTKNFPLSIPRAGIRIRIQKFRSNLRAVLNILCIDKGEEKEGTFHDNGGSLLVLLTSFHGQRDLENDRFIAVQRDQTSGMKPLLRGR